MNIDTIDSLQILSGAMDAEYGRALGGAINIGTINTGSCASRPCKNGGVCVDGGKGREGKAPSWCKRAGPHGGAKKRTPLQHAPTGSAS